jgi:hypothetical protein
MTDAQANTRKPVSLKKRLNEFIAETFTCLFGSSRIGRDAVLHLLLQVLHAIILACCDLGIFMQLHTFYQVKKGLICPRTSSTVQNLTA